MLKIGMTAAFASLAFAGAAAATDLSGLWQTGDGRGQVQISPCDGSLCGRLVIDKPLPDNPAEVDIKNKNPALRTRSLKGLLILQGFHQDGDAWIGGSIYDPSDGGTYKANLTPTGPTTMTVRGCIFVPLCKTQTWTRLR